MSHTSGTATSYTDLLDRLDQFLINTGHAWGKKFTGTGTGDLISYNGTASSVAETFTLTAINANTFSVVGSVSGALANATVGTPYTSAVVAFTITAGGTAYVAGDVWRINTSPKWLRLRRAGCSGSEKRTTNLVTLDSLFDGNVNTTATRAATTAFIEWEMIAPTEVRELVIQTWTSTNNPAAFSLDWKDNAGDAWTTAQSWTGQTWTNQQTRVYTLTAAPGAHRFWRWNMTATNGSSLEIAELYLRQQVSQPYQVQERAEYVWRGYGLDGTKELYVGAETFGSSGVDTYNVGLTGFSTWDSTASASAQANGTAMRYLSLANANIGYWIVANGQRFVLVTKNNSVYQIAYAGFGFPYEPPSAHNWPMLVGASSNQRGLRFNSNDTSFRFPIDPGRYGLACFFPDAQWREPSNRYLGSADGSADTPTGGLVWPAVMNPNKTHTTWVRDNLDGTKPLIPAVIAHRLAAPLHVWGEFDGLYWTPGFSVASESIIREDRFNHLVVQNCFRTGAQHFGAVRLD